MYHILLTFLTWLLSQCAARPAANEAASLLDSAIPSDGFPPPVDGIEFKPASDLNLPLGPDRNLQSTFTPGSGLLQKGGMSVVSLAYEIYWYWRDDSTVPFRRTFDRHKPPFEDFWYTVSPFTKNRASLTPLKTGIAYSRALWSLVRLGWWPRTFEIDISERPYGFGIGTLSVRYEPIHSANNGASTTVAQTSVSKTLEETLRANSTIDSIVLPLPSQDAPNSTKLDIPDSLMERRWYFCWTQLFRFFVTKPTSGLITDKYVPRSEPMRNYCDNSPLRTTRDEIGFTVYGPAADPRHGFTWQKLAEEVLIWGGMIIDGSPYNTVLYVKDGATVLGAMSIWIKDP